MLRKNIARHVTTCWQHVANITSSGEKAKRFCSDFSTKGLGNFIRSLFICLMIYKESLSVEPGYLIHDVYHRDKDICK